MSERGWKKAERMIAGDFGGKRIAVTGERDGADVSHELFAFQLKVRKALPAWLFTWLNGICGTAKRQNKVGVLILRRPREARRNALVILRWGDWVDLHGTPPLPEQVHAIDCDLDDDCTCPWKEN
jgi:hypothetical protein